MEDMGRLYWVADNFAHSCTGEDDDSSERCLPCLAGRAINELTERAREEWRHLQALVSQR